MNVADSAVAIAVMIFLNNACKAAASAFFVAGRVSNDNAVTGTNATGTPIHNKIFGKIILSIEDVVFICVSINIAVPIIKKPVAAKIFGFIYFESSPAIISPARQIIALGNIVNPDFDGL